MGPMSCALSVVTWRTQIQTSRSRPPGLVRPRSGHMIRVLIADDSAAVREGLISLLGAHPDFEIVGAAGDGLEAIRMTHELSPDLVIMDAQMPRLAGVEATRRINRAFPMVGILFFSVFSEYVEAGLAAGADGYLAKDCEPDQLIGKASEIVARIRSRIEKCGRS